MARLSLSGHLTDFDLKLLRVFKTVVDCGGFSAAQVELNIGRSAISRHIADLESRLDMRLCQRGRAGFCLTEQGQFVYEATQQLLLDLEAFRVNINAAHRRLRGALKVGLTDNMVTDASSPLVAAFSRFHQREPKVTLDLLVSAPNDIERAVIEGRVHLGVVPYHHHLPGLEYHDLHRETSHLYCGDQHPLYSTPDDALKLQDLDRHHAIAPGYIHSMISAELPALNTQATTGQVEGAATLILSGQYLGFLPDHYAEQWLARGRMRCLMPERFHYAIPFKVITRQNAQPSPLRLAFLNVLLSPLSERLN